MSRYRKRFSNWAVAASVLMTLLLTPSAWSWGRLGHRVAAEFAESRLTPHALSAIHNLLGSDVSLADVSTWADEQREIRGSASWLTDLWLISGAAGKARPSARPYLCIKNHWKAAVTDEAILLEWRSGL